MPAFLVLITSFFLLTIISSCKKDNHAADKCFPDAPTVRRITDKKAVIRLTATIHPVWLIEEGAIDTKLIPCNFPMEFYQDGLQVIISGDVKFMPQSGPGPCCMENFVITKISK